MLGSGCVIMITYYRWIYQGRQMACYPDVEARRCFVFVRSWLEIGAGVSLVKLEHNVGSFFLNCGQIVVMPVPIASTLF